jgi:anti-sigma-K factor RskA
MHRDPACEKYEALLEDYVAGELASAEVARAEKHVASCHGCRNALDEATSGSRLLRFAAPLIDGTPDPGLGFARVVMARIRTEELKASEGLSFWQPFVSLAWKFAATAAFALALLLTYTITGTDRPETEVASVSQAEVQDLFAPDPTLPPADRDEALMMVTGSDYVKH